MRRVFLATLAALALGAAPAAAQQPTTPPADTTRRPTAPADTAARAPADTAARSPVRRDTTQNTLRVKPGTAMIHSMILPGWGQLQAGAGGRAAVYFAGEAANLAMLTKTWLRLADARDRRDERHAAVKDSVLLAAQTDSLLAMRLENPLALDSIVRADTAFDRARKLTKARRRQREDWITYTVFWMLASGVDAFVTAELSDFPGDVGVAPKPGGGMEVRWTLPARKPGFLR